MISLLDMTSDIRVDQKSTDGIIAGTNVMTMQGELPVETLAVGDKIITRDSGMAVLREIRILTLSVAPIRFKAGSLGHTRPDRDTYLSPDAKVHLRDWRAQALYGKSSVLVCASKIVDGEYVAQMPCRDVMAFELVFDQEHILYADGLEVGSSSR